MSVPYNGDYLPGSNVFIWFNSFTSNDPSASVTMTNFINTDVHIYKDDSLTQRQNAAGVAVDVDVDTYAGVHKITIDTADNTVADFFEAGHDYAVVIEGTTIDAGTVNACVGTFSIANRRVAGQMCSSSIEAYTDTTNFTLTTGEASADNDAYNGCTIIVTDQVTKIQKAVGHISDYVGNTRAIVLHAAPLQTGYTMAVGDSVEIFATAAMANVNTVGQTAQTANDGQADINTILSRVTGNVALANVVGALADAAADGAVTEADTLMKYIKQLINILIGAPGVVTYPAEAAPANGVSLAEVIRAIHADVTGLNGSAMVGTNSAATAAKLLAYIQLLARSDAAIETDNATELTEINADGGSGAGNFSSQTEAQEALQDRDFNATQKASINTEADTALSDINLDHLMKVATSNRDTLPEVVDDTVLANLMTKTDGDTSDFDHATDSLEALRDKTPPAGTIEFTYTMRIDNEDTGDLLEGVEVFISTDSAGSNAIWSGTTDANGILREVVGNSKPWLDAGTYYLWRKKSGYSFTNPDTEVVS